MKIIYKRNYIMGISILITFGIQYAFYPGVIIMSSNMPSFFTSSSWFIITMVTYHSFFDTLGRYIAGKINIIPKQIFIWVCLSRIIFIITFMF